MCKDCNLTFAEMCKRCDLSAVIEERTSKMATVQTRGPLFLAIEPVVKDYIAYPDDTLDISVEWILSEGSQQRYVEARWLRNVQSTNDICRTLLDDLVKNFGTDVVVKPLLQHRTKSTLFKPSQNNLIK